MKKNKWLTIANIALFAAIIITDILYIIHCYTDIKIGSSGLLIKSIASAFFFILGVVNCVYVCVQKKKADIFAIILTVGLLFAFVGDVVINLDFISGAALFAVGHIFFFASYCFIQKFKVKDLLYSLIIFVPSVLIITLVPIFDFDILMEIVCIAYAMIISLMLGKAIANTTRDKKLLTILILIGSSLFFFSDFMLLFSTFASISKAFGILCLASYYPAELLLAHSILYKDNQQ